MSRPQRNLLIAVFILVVAGLAGLGAGLLRDNIDETPSVQGGPGVVPVTSTTPEETVTDSLSSPSTAPRTDAAWASLEVRVVDPHGALLPQATIQATREDSGAALQSRGRAFWTELDPGAWQLEVAHVDYPTHRTGVHLAGGASLRHIMQLDTQLPVRGRVIDRYGRARAATRIWFLGPGDYHPDDGGAESPPMVSPPQDAPLGTSSDRRGRFAVELPEAGPWRVSLGPAGGALAAMGSPRELNYGDRGQLEVVLSGTTWLEVVCTSGATEGGVYVRILRRTEQRVDEPPTGPGVLPPNTLGGESGIGRGATGDRTKKQVNTQGGERVGEDPSPWTTFAGRLLVEGRVIFDRLPPGEELRFAVQRGEALNEASSSFSVLQDQRAHIEFDLDELPLERDAQGDALPLAIRFRSTPLQNDEHPAGFHWAQ